jgi:hypothetical protein
MIIGMLARYKLATRKTSLAMTVVQTSHPMDIDLNPYMM